jgi:hypothetical protein
MSELLDNGDPAVVCALRDNLPNHDLIRDAMAFTEGRMLIQHCLQTIENDQLKAAVQHIANSLQPPTEAPLNDTVLPPFLN